MSGKCNDQKPMEGNKRNSKRDIHNNRCLHQEIRKISNKKPNLIPQRTRKRIKSKVNKTGFYEH